MSLGASWEGLRASLEGPRARWEVPGGDGENNGAFLVCGCINQPRMSVEFVLYVCLSMITKVFLNVILVVVDFIIPLSTLDVQYVILFMKRTKFCQLLDGSL